MVKKIMSSQTRAMKLPRVEAKIMEQLLPAQWRGRGGHLTQFSCEAGDPHRPLD
jgi:hypothetical protein